MLDDLAPTIKNTANLVQQVAAASNTQSSGVAQISQAMARIDLVTQQTAASAAELTSMATEMTSQAEALQASIALFQIEAAPNREFTM